MHFKAGSHIIAAIVSIAAVNSKSGLNNWDDYMRTLHKRSLMPAAIGATAITWIARVLSGRLVADRGDRERFCENWVLFLESPEDFSGPKSQLPNCSPLVLKS